MHTFFRIFSRMARRPFGSEFCPKKHEKSARFLQFGAFRGKNPANGAIWGRFWAFLRLFRS